MKYVASRQNALITHLGCAHLKPACLAIEPIAMNVNGSKM